MEEFIEHTVLRRRYPQNHIVEAICEFHFAPSWELTEGQISSFVERLTGAYPRQESYAVRSVTVRVSDTRSSHEIGELGQGRRLVSEERLDIVQVAPGSISVHRLAPYDHWENFEPRIMTVRAALQDVSPEARTQRLGMRYINRFELRLPEALDRLFVGVPRLPGQAGEKLGNFYFRSELVDPEIPDRVLTVTLGLAPKSAVILDLARSHIRTAEGESEVLEQLTEAHARIGQAFEDSITEALRTEYLGSGKEQVFDA